jgi:hypothetical protein
MRATIRVCQEKMEVAMNNIWSNFWKQLATSILASVGQRTHNLCKEPDTQIQGAQLDEQAIRAFVNR